MSLFFFTEQFDLSLSLSQGHILHSTSHIIESYMHTKTSNWFVAASRETTLAFKNALINHCLSILAITVYLKFTSVGGISK